ncbi:MAG TPA: hypothetical protein DEB06_07085 [Phycisphaerales bacterium]|nr:hypothetical protein [Phycisphaerales bacterium]
MALFASAGTVVQAGMLLDSFSTTQQISIGPGGVNPATASSSVGTGGTSVGGARTLELTRDTGGTVVATRVNIDAGILGFGTEPGVGGGLMAIYDGDLDPALNPTGLGGVDFTESGDNASVRVTYRYDLALEFFVTVYTDAGNASRASFVFGGTAGFNGPFNVALLPFASFTPILGAGADFTNIGAMTFSASTTSPTLGADFQLDTIDLTREVPTPGALALIGLAGVVVAGRRRR